MIRAQDGKTLRNSVITNAPGCMATRRRRVQTKGGTVRDYVNAKCNDPRCVRCFGRDALENRSQSYPYPGMDLTRVK